MVEDRDGADREGGEAENASAHEQETPREGCRVGLGGGDPIAREKADGRKDDADPTDDEDPAYPRMPNGLSRFGAGAVRGRGWRWLCHA